MHHIDANPYLLMQVAQFDFKKADAFAKSRGLRPMIRIGSLPGCSTFSGRSVLTRRVDLHYDH
ncbi:hypothetical protein PY99_11040, partial [Lacticaseibacillus rhamnosus]